MVDLLEQLNNDLAKTEKKVEQVELTIAQHYEKIAELDEIIAEKKEQLECKKVEMKKSNERTQNEFEQFLQTHGDQLELLVGKDAFDEFVSNFEQSIENFIKRQEEFEKRYHLNMNKM